MIDYVFTFVFFVVISLISFSERIDSVFYITRIIIRSNDYLLQRIFNYTGYIKVDCSYHFHYIYSVKLNAPWHNLVLAVQYYLCFMYHSLHKKWNFPLKIPSVNVTRSPGNCGFWSQVLKKSLMENFIPLAVIVTDLFMYRHIFFKIYTCPARLAGSTVGDIILFWNIVNNSAFSHTYSIQEPYLQRGCSLWKHWKNS